MTPHRNLLLGALSAGVLAVALVTGGSSSAAPSASPLAKKAVKATSGVKKWAGKPVSVGAIPLGDGDYTTSPKKGYVYSCQTSFDGGGAEEDGPWIDTAKGVWTTNGKIVVQGSVSWPSASHSFTTSGSTRTLVTNSLPVGATTGTFPTAANDPAYQYDRNPNTATAQDYDWSVPTTPKAASSPSCLSRAAIGVFLNGVVFFNALDEGGRDAAAHEIQDSCDGHPEAHGIYHYHSFSPCLATAATKKKSSSTLVGYALDGFGIYVERDAKGNLPTDANLDVCHGRTSKVLWNGKLVKMYHYDVTTEFPYTMGCYHGTPASTDSTGQPSGPPSGQPSGQPSGPPSGPPSGHPSQMPPPPGH